MTIKPTWDNIQLTNKGSYVNADLKVWEICGWLPEQLVNHGLAVVTQPAFIDGAKYFIHPLKDLGIPLNGVKFIYDSNTNRFNGHAGIWLKASDFGKHFTTELVTMGPAPTPPAKQALSSIDALSRYLTTSGSDVNEIAGKALSRLKEQAVTIGRVGKLNEICQKHGIGSIGDSVIDSVIDYITSHECATTVAQPRNKYDREILPGVYVDVYDVLGAFKTNSVAIDHAVKKLLAPGQRGVKDRITDLNEAIESIQREIDRVSQWDFVPSKPMSVNKIRKAMDVEPTEGDKV